MTCIQSIWTRLLDGSLAVKTNVVGVGGIWTLAVIVDVTGAWTSSTIVDDGTGAWTSAKIVVGEIGTTFDSRGCCTSTTKGALQLIIC